MSNHPMKRRNVMIHRLAAHPGRLLGMAALGVAAAAALAACSSSSGAQTGGQPSAQPSGAQGSGTNNGTGDGTNRTGGFGPRAAAQGEIAQASGATLQVQSTSAQTTVTYSGT